MAAGVFDGYTQHDAFNDWLLNNDETIQRASGAFHLGAGAVGTVGSGILATGSVPACLTTGVGCGVTVLGAVGTYYSWQEATEGQQQLVGPYNSTIGQRVLDSFNPATYPGDQDRAAELGISAIQNAALLVAGNVFGRLGGKAAPVDAGKATNSTGVVTAQNFFDGSQYTSKVLNQAASGDYHGFPQSVDAFSGNGTVTQIVGGDGVTRWRLTIPGSYNGQTGVFEYIRNQDGTINHRLFVPNR